MAAKTEKGRKRSAETKAKIAATLAGRKRSEAEKRRIAAGCRGVRKSKTAKGVRKAPEHREAISEAIKRRNEAVENGDLPGRKMDDLEPPFFGVCDTYYVDDEIIGDF